MNFEYLERHPDDATLSTIPALIENGVRQLNMVLSDNKIRLKLAKRLAETLDGPLRRGKAEEKFSGTNDGGGGLAKEDIPDTSEDDEAACGSALSALGQASSIGSSIELPERGSPWLKRISKPFRNAGQAFFIGLVPGVGPVICCYLSYRHVYVPLKDLKVESDDLNRLRKHIKSNMWQDLALGLILPVIGSFANRSRQSNLKSVVYATNLSIEHLQKCEQSYQEFVHFLDESQQITRQPISSAFTDVFMNEVSTENVQVHSLLELPASVPITPTFNLNPSLPPHFLQPADITQEGSDSNDQGHDEGFIGHNLTSAQQVKEDYLRRYVV
ncbi:hypothetical protein BGZ65_006784 [Modicella reniformis]|uniref:Uncharacterized protein n=1 Tax=Modicella reniformis TaxID=1440133 RepID=A0A9P6IN60_9FUNG|nr:hypothetical protein BGZ65_006784 [Modicella reniformis]